MGLFKEPKNADLSTKSEPWTDQELVDFKKGKQPGVVLIEGVENFGLRGNAMSERIL